MESPTEDTSALDASGSAVSWRADRSIEQVQQDLKVTVAVLVFYVIDALLLALLCATGAGSWSTPAAFLATGFVVSGGAISYHRRNQNARLDSPGMVLVQVICALALTLGVLWTDPVMLLPMLLTQVVMLSTAAIRLRPRQVLALCLLTAAGTFGAVSHQPAIAFPLASTVQQAALVLWVLWTLVKGATTNITGMALRLEIDASHRRLAEALARVQELADRDALTGLYNRRRVLEALAQERDRYQRSGVGFSVAMLDIDHFKRINDRFGHPVGDAVLRDVAALMLESLRNHDVVGRFGGEEFLLVLPGAPDGSSARRVAERVCQRIQSHDWSKISPALTVTASVGLAVSRIGEPAETLLDRSDQGLYQAKHSGRNQVADGPAAAPVAGSATRQSIAMPPKPPPHKPPAPPPSTTDALDPHPAAEAIAKTP